MYEADNNFMGSVVCDVDTRQRSAGYYGRAHKTSASTLSSLPAVSLTQLSSCAWMDVMPALAPIIPYRISGHPPRCMSTHALLQVISYRPGTKNLFVVIVALTGIIIKQLQFLQYITPDIKIVVWNTLSNILQFKYKPKLVIYTLFIESNGTTHTLLIYLVGFFGQYIILLYNSKSFLIPIPENQKYFYYRLTHFSIYLIHSSFELKNFPSNFFYANRSHDRPLMHGG